MKKILAILLASMMLLSLLPAAVAESAERLRLNYRLIHLTDRAALPFDSPPPCLFDPAAEKTHDVLRRAGVL